MSVRSDMPWEELLIPSVVLGFVAVAFLAKPKGFSTQQVTDETPPDTAAAVSGY